MKIQYTYRGMGIIISLEKEETKNERNNNKQHKCPDSTIHNDIHTILSKKCIHIQLKLKQQNTKNNRQKF